VEELINKILIQYRSELIAEIDKAETLLRLRRIYDSGQVLEIALKKLFKRLLPHYVGVTRGVVIDSSVKDKSAEIDLIIYDKRYFSGFEINDNLNDSVSVISIDTVFGVMSVKKKLTLTSLEESISNINTVYNLDRRSIQNQLHYDLNLGKSLSYKGGIELNRIFSCVITYENDLLFKTEEQKKVKRSEDEIRTYFNKIAEDGKFNDSKIDLIFSINGVLIYPMTYNQANGEILRNLSTLNFGTKKEVIQEEGHIDELIDKQLLAYTIDEEEPQIILGQFIVYLQVYIKELIKSSPNIPEMFKNFFETSQINIIGNEKKEKGST